MITRWCPVCGAKNVREGGYVLYRCVSCRVTSHFMNWFLAKPDFCKKCNKLAHYGFEC